MWKSIILFVAVALGWSAAPGTVHADERYYMIMFASQGEPKTARLSHTFAMFVKASGSGTFPADYRIETRTISWMPKSLVLQPLRRTPVEGVNLDLADTLKWARSVGIGVTTWGPFRIQPELYAMAARQAERLNTNPGGHIIFDGRYRGEGASNCIHAVSDLDTSQTLLMTGTAYGNEGSQIVLDHFRRYITPSQESARWLVERLHLKSDEVQFAADDTRTAGK